jgi:hypothetical protein
VFYEFAFNSVSHDPTTGSHGFNYTAGFVSFTIMGTDTLYFGGAFGSPLQWASNAISVNISELTAPEQQLASAALAQWASVAPLTFTFTSGAADITYTDSGSDSIATTTDAVAPSGQYLQAETIDISTAWFDTDGGTMDGRSGFGSYDFQTYLARTGRALGVGTKVPWLAISIEGTVSSPTVTDNTLANDSLQDSVLSAAAPSNFGGSHYVYAVSPQRDDISAIQSIYGVASARTGDTVYGFHSTAGALYDFATYAGFGAPTFTIYDTGGINSLDASGYSANQVIDLESGTWSSIGGSLNNIFIYATTTVQNAVGGSGNDLIIANPNAKGTLTGGGGNDIFEGSFAGLSGQTITDLNVGDGIQFIDSSAFYGFGFERSGTTLTYADINGLHALTLANSPVGHIIATPLQANDGHGHSGTAIDLTLVNPTSTSDFGDTGISDVLWRSSTGALAVWAMNQGQVVNSFGMTATPGPSWNAAEIADFNGDGHSDILWRNTDGTVVDWSMNGPNIWQSQGVGTADASWTTVGAGDFDGNGTADVLWRNSDGRLSQWFMSGHGVVGNSTLAIAPDASWNVAGVGDFNGDGRSDILWRNDNGTLALWSMNGATIADSQTVAAAPDQSWKIAGIGDFNGNSNADILWRSSSGTLVEWLMNGSQIAASQAIATVPDPSWSIVQMGDFNSDGRTDVLWRQAGTGALADWLMSGSQITSSQSIAVVPGSNWQVQSNPVNSAV